MSEPKTLAEVLNEFQPKREISGRWEDQEIKIETPIEYLNNWTEKHCQDMCKPEITKGGHFKISDDLLEDIFVKKFLSKEDVIELIYGLDSTENWAWDWGGQLDEKTKSHYEELKSRLRKLYPEIKE